MTAEDWFRLEMPPWADLDRPGIFAWIVDGEPVYVGRATPLRDHWRAYERNLDRMRGGDGYRPDDPDGFRAVHEDLRQAREASRPILFRVLEVCASGKDLTERKRHWVAELRPRLNGQPRPRRTT